MLVFAELAQLCRPIRRGLSVVLQGLLHLQTAVAVWRSTASSAASRSGIAADRPEGRSLHTGRLARVLARTLSCISDSCCPTFSALAPGQLPQKGADDPGELWTRSLDVSQAAGAAWGERSGVRSWVSRGRLIPAVACKLRLSYRDCKGTNPANRAFHALFELIHATLKLQP